MVDVNVTELDLYDILGVDQQSTTQDIKKAYRKKALSCHPDKNPDDVKAVQRFHTLSKALEILIDVSARAAYDKVFNAKKEAKARHRKLDARRKKLKEDLEAREQAAMKTTILVADTIYPKYKSDEEKLKAEIERLRKQGSKELEKEIEIVRKQVEEQWRDLQKNLKDVSTTDHSDIMQCNNRLRIRWKNKEGKVAYTEEILQQLFSKYGTISAIVILKKHAVNSKGVAIIEFENRDSAQKALQSEKGSEESPLVVESLYSSKNQKSDHTDNKIKSNEKNDQQSSNEIHSREKLQFPYSAKTFPAFLNASQSFSPEIVQNVPAEGSPISMREHLDFESLVIRRMRQAQERKRLEDRIRDEEEEEDKI